MTSDKRVAVLGGGISGLSLAWRLRELGVAVDVFEAEQFVGGLAGTVRPEDGAYCLDFGPHFFITQKQEIVERITDLLGDEVVQFERSAQIYFQGRFLDYPLSARNVLLHFPIADAVASVATFGAAQLRRAVERVFGRDGDNLNVREWATRNFGSHLTRVFFQPYTENFWKLSTDELSADTIPTSTRLNFLKSLKLLLTRRVSGDAKSLTERELVLPLRYPPRGYGVIAETVAERVTALGGRIHLGACVTALETIESGQHRITAQSTSGTHQLDADFVVSTIPIPGLIKMLSPSPPTDVLESAARLGYLAMIVLYIVTPDRPLLDTSYVYYLGRPYHRLSDMNKFCADLCPPGENMLAVEYSCHSHQPIWQMDTQELMQLSLPGLLEDEVLSREDVKKVFVVKSASAYPISYLGYRPHLDKVKAFIYNRPGLALLGRTGEYRYIDSDQCMERAFALAEDIARSGVA
ncbi:MAG: FAD-dependent oxidoreductase [Methyloligellaceae bacterium]